jgi:2-C-methyl-D-erythritol 4-phosphate cytidylyltransferase
VGVTIWAIVVAGGEGRRFGRAKQFSMLGERSVIEWALDSARTVATGVVAVLPESMLSDPELKVTADRVVAGGSTRSASVRAGLAAVPTDAEVVVVHDAARPLASPALFRAVVDAVVAGADGAIPGIPMPDTVKRVHDGLVTATLDRGDLVAVQTPQAFRAGALRRAHEGEPEATDDAGLIEALRLSVAVVPGEEHNLKITTPEDLVAAEHWMDR